MKTIDLASLTRKNILRLTPYSSARDEFAGGAAHIFLDANENPFPTDFHRYPDPHQRKLKAALAGLKGIPAESIFLGNGSDEPIDLLYRAFCEPGVHNVVIPQPTYGMYSVSAAVNNVEERNVPLSDSFQLQPEAVLAACDAHTRIIFLCSPNNPTGNLLRPEDVHLLLQRFDGIVVVDEAYIDFATQPGWLPQLKNFQNLVVLQTLSKAWGLASLRIGMAFAHPTVVEILTKIKPPYNLGGPVQIQALEALTNVAKMERQVATLRQERNRLMTALAALPCVQKVYPSDANFILVQVTDAALIYQFLLRRGIVVRDRSKVAGCTHCLRITVGTPEENSALLDALRLAG